MGRTPTSTLFQLGRYAIYISPFRSNLKYSISPPSLPTFGNVPIFPRIGARAQCLQRALIVSGVYAGFTPTPFPRRPFKFNHIRASTYMPRIAARAQCLQRAVMAVGIRARGLSQFPPPPYKPIAK